MPTPGPCSALRACAWSAPPKSPAPPAQGGEPRSYSSFGPAARQGHRRPSRPIQRGGPLPHRWAPRAAREGAVPRLRIWKILPARVPSPVGAGDRALRVADRPRVDPPGQTGIERSHTWDIAFVSKVSRSAPGGSARGCLVSALTCQWERGSRSDLVSHRCGSLPNRTNFSEILRSRSAGPPIVYSSGAISRSSVPPAYA